MPQIDKLYRVGKTIVYNNPGHPLFQQVVKPGIKQNQLAPAYPNLEPKKLLAIKSFDAKTGELTLPFPHVDEAGIAILLRTKTILPA